MNVYCGEWGECVLCDAQRTSTGNWTAVVGSAIAGDMGRLRAA